MAFLRLRHAAAACKGGHILTFRAQPDLQSIPNVKIILRCPNNFSQGVCTSACGLRLVLNMLQRAGLAAWQISTGIEVSFRTCTG